MRKFLSLVLVLACVATLFVGCNGMQRVLNGGKTLTAETYAETIVYQSVTALQSAEELNIVPDAQTTNPETPADSGEVVNPDTPADSGEVTNPDAPANPGAVVEPQAPTFEDQIGGIMAGADLLASSKTQVSVTASDREGYEYKATLKYGTVECVVYMNCKMEEETEVEEEEEDGEIVIEEEYEATKEFNGIIIFNGNEFTFKGETVIEKEGNEVEEELSLEIYINENTYISIKQKFEVEENEREESFEYRFYKDGNLVDEYKISKEVEGEEGELKIVKNGEKFEYKYYIQDEAEYIQIVKDTMTEVYQKVLNVDGTYSYDVVENVA